MLHIQSGILIRSHLRRAVVLATLTASFALFAGMVPEPPFAGVTGAYEDVTAPATLAATGLYSDPSILTIDPAHIAFAPQYPLWTDGAAKRRWIYLPPGEVIDASDPDAWDFPVGTRFWKEFSFAGHRVETRFMQRLADGSWLFATYRWDAEGVAADLISEKGRKGAYDLGNGTSHAIPSLTDCRICHLSGAVPVLGFSARQLASDNVQPVVDAATPPMNPQLQALAARGILAGLNPRLLLSVTRGAAPLDQAAQGYLHGNCSHCHNTVGPLAKLGLDLRQPALNPGSGVMATAAGHPLRSPPPGLQPGTTLRLVPGDPQHSAIPQRMASRVPALQMPPLGTALPDAEGVALITRWIAEMEHSSIEARLNQGDEK